MAQAGLLLPSESLFIVDRSWRIHGDPARSAFEPFTENGLKVHRASHIKARGVRPRRLGESPINTSNAHGKNKNGYQFVAADQTGGRQDNNARNTVRKQARKYVSSARKNKPPSKHHDALDIQPSGHNQKPDTVSYQDGIDFESNFNLMFTLPTSSLALYGNDHASDLNGLDRYINYYRDVVTEIANPLGAYTKLEYDLIRGICITLAMGDRLYLRTLLLVSAIHYSHLTNSTEPKLVNNLARSVLQELRDRISRKYVSDATLLSVSCIALLENWLGNHDEWRVHATGLSNMLELRGGPNMIDASIRWKIYRAIMVGAVNSDNLPFLSRPPSVEPATQNLVSRSYTEGYSFQHSLIYQGIQTQIQNMLLHIQRFIDILKDSVDGGTQFGTCFYHHRCAQIQHDLLHVKTSTPIDEVWRIASLAFVDTFLRTRLGTVANNIILSGKLRGALEEASDVFTNKEHYLWILLNGTMLSPGTEHHVWFLKTLTYIARDLECTTWDDMKAILQDILWLDMLHDESGREIWAKISSSILDSSFSIE